MKSATVICAFVVLACLCLQAKADNSRFEETCPEEDELLPKTITGPGCTQITCKKRGGSQLSCPRLGCPAGERSVDSEPDYSKPYPYCCPEHKCEPFP